MESTGLKKKYTFDNLKLDNLDLAVMASKANIAQPFSQMYNPLFLHGNSESTRAHLLHAIGNEFVRLYPKKSVLFTTGKRLFADLRKLSAFECFQMYHSYDVVLIDEVNEVALDDKYVENLAVLFENLCSRDHQVVFSAGGDVKVLRAVARRVMRDKFAGGMMVGM